MISEVAFQSYQTKAAQRKYSSLQYAEYNDCRMADEVYADDETLVLCDFNQMPAKLDFAANDFDQVISQTDKIAIPLRINFVPYDFQHSLILKGFDTLAEFVDYFNQDLTSVLTKRYTLEDMDLMKWSESKQVSQLSKRCVGLSRGYFGEEAEYFSKWMDDGNQVLLVRHQEQIVGFCCVSIYAKGMTLWVREVAVDPTFQGRGYGKLLMEQAISYGIEKGAVKGFLAVDTTNRKAISIYQKYGFTKSNEAGELQMVRR